MNCGITRSISIAILCAELPLAPISFAQTNALPQDPDLAAVEKVECVSNLSRIYVAIQKYQADHKDLPNWLSDLVPQYIDDTNCLYCPVFQRTGEKGTGALSDPKIPNAYYFEFCPAPLGSEAPSDPARTWREWKRRQMGLVGSVVPLIRCRLHDTELNLAYDGRIYESTGSWEVLVTNQVDIGTLAANRMFPGAPPAHAASLPPTTPTLRATRPPEVAASAKTFVAPRHQKFIWSALGFLAGCLCVLIALVSWRLRRSKSHSAPAGLIGMNMNTAPALLPPPNNPPLVYVVTDNPTQTQTQPLRLPVESEPMREAIHAGVVAQLSHWLKEKLVQRLLSDRQHLLATQQAAAMQVFAVDERLAKVEQQMHQRSHDYEKRIDGLLKELVSAREENCELIRTQIARVKDEMEKERLKAVQYIKEHQKN